MLRFRAMDDSDYIRYTQGIVSDGNLGKDEQREKGLYSNSIFGIDREEREDGSIPQTRSLRRGRIELPVPIVNYAVTGSAGSNLFSRILGIDQKIFTQIMNFSIAYSKKTREFVRVTHEDKNPYDDYLVQSQIILEEIEQFNIETAIKKELKKITKDCFKSEEEDFAYTGDHHVFGGWYYNGVLPEKSLVKLDHLVRHDLIKSGNERIVYLCNLESKDVLRNLVLTKISVLPPDLRPPMGNFHDKFTSKYSKIIKRSNELKDRTSASLTLGDFVSLYKSLNKEVTELIYKSDPKDTKQKSLVENNSSKFGRLRNNMLGKRADFTGRSAIIVNPKLKLDQIGIPIAMLGKLYRHHLMKGVPIQQLDRLLKKTDQEIFDELTVRGILETIPVAINRAPTLHRLSFRAYYVVPSVTKAIELHPLSCPGYNADFDGDQMAVHVPLLEESISEVIELMLSTRNLFIPATGEHTMLPRQEIIYGLNIASKDYNNRDSAIVASYKTLDEVKEAVMTHKRKVYERVTVTGYGAATAGEHTIRWCLPKGMHDKIVPITKKTIVDYADTLLEYKLKAYCDSINKMVEVGFKLAQLYAPATSIIDELPPDSFLRNPFKDFHQNIKQVSDLYARGFEDEETFNTKFDDEFKKVTDKMEAVIYDELGPDNGYSQLVQSGARGSKDNLIQIYGYKGRIQKNSVESFRAVIEKSFADQLSPLEHFISAYGTRKGMIDKVQKTGDTGYANRKMYQAAADVVVRTKDCGTTIGLPIRIKDISRHIHLEEEGKKAETVNKIFLEAITGRYVASGDRMFNADSRAKEETSLQRILEESGPLEHIAARDKFNKQAETAAAIKKNNYFVTAKLAKEVVERFSGVQVRSALMCKEQCCAKCYGTDLTSRGKASVGLPGGFIAGQSIGEPGTQLTMRTFHKGGVAGKSDVTSDFDRMSGFLDVSNITKKPTYDPIAWADGPVVVKEQVDKLSVSIGGHNRRINLPKGAELKKFVTRGEGLCSIEGDHYVKEVLEYSGETQAKLYLLYAMYVTYLGKADVNFKHFEVLISEMFRYYVSNSEGRNLKPGLFYSRKEIFTEKVRLNEEGTDYEEPGIVYYPVILSATNSQIVKNDPLNAVLMERFIAGLGRSVLLGLESTHETQMGRMLLSQRLKVGTGLNANYIKERKEEEAYVD